MGNLNSYKMILVHEEALKEYMNYALCICQGCKSAIESKGCKKSGCKLHKAETILEKDLYGNKRKEEKSNG